MLTINILLNLTLFYDVKQIMNFQLNFSFRFIIKLLYIRKYILGPILCV